MIDWSRVAEPQADSYDYHIASELNFARYGHVEVPRSRIRIHGVAVVEALLDNDYMTPISILDINVDRVWIALSRWHLARSVARHVHTWTPYRFRDWTGGRGCSSGNTHPREAGGLVKIFSTVDDPIGGADGFVHECAHQKLYALGIDLEEHDGLLLKSNQDKKFFSPVRRDVLRPMTAVIHGIYAWTHMIALELAQDKDGLPYLAVNVPKVRMGLRIINDNAETTDIGRAFLDGFLAWSRRLVAECEVVLQTAGVEEVPVPGLGE